MRRGVYLLSLAIAGCSGMLRCLYRLRHLDNIWSTTNQVDIVHIRFGCTRWASRGLCRSGFKCLRRRRSHNKQARSAVRSIGFWKDARVALPRRKETVTMRLDANLLEWVRSEPGYQTRINAILRAYMHAHAGNR